MAGARWPALAVASLVTVALVACTGAGPEPAPSPTASAAPTTAPAEPTGLRVGVVLPLRTVSPVGPAAIRAAVGDLRVATRDDVRELRMVQPDGPAFVGDLVALLADEGYDLVCAVGPDVTSAVLDVAADHPEVRFCATPAQTIEDPPANVHLLGLRVEQAAYLAGAAAAEGIAPPPQLDDESPAALQPGLVGDPSVAAVDGQVAAYAAGLGRRINRPIEVTTGVPSEDPGSTYEQTRFILQANGEVVFGSAGTSLEELTQAAVDTGGLVVALADARTVIEDPSASLLAVIRIDLGVALEVAVRAAIAGDPPTVVDLGVTESAITVEAGGAGRSAQAVAAAQAAAADLVAGRVTLP